jgi:serine/threonine protein kinase
LSVGTVTLFGKYELLERLGAGGMATVYRARYTAGPGIIKPVVIKRVLDHFAQDPDFVEMFIQEARISVGLNHGNIVQVFDFGQVDGEYYLAMELVDGQPLSALLKRAQAMGLSQLPAPLSVLIAIEMCKGLHHAHRRTDEQGRLLGLVHRDVSPDNVLVSYEGEVKISDFGIAKAQVGGRRMTEAGMVKGKVLYMSPEQMRGQELDARSDVYSVGVVLYRMLCGRLPVEGTELVAMQRVVQGQLTHPRQLNPDLDGGLVQILMDTLAFQREARIRSAEALHQQLSHWLATRAPLFPVHALKHLMGALYEEELTAQGRTPTLPPKFKEQMTLWGNAFVPDAGATRVQMPRSPSREMARPPTREMPRPPTREMARPPSREMPSVTPHGAALSMMAPAALLESVPVTDESPAGQDDALQTQPGGPLAELTGDTDKAPFPNTKETPVVTAPPVEEREDPEDSSLIRIERVPHFWLWVIGAVSVAALSIKLIWPLMFRVPPLEVNSSPRGALVRVNDTAYGVTPLTVKGLDRSDAYRVELSMPGMQPWSKHFPAGTLGEALVVSLEPVKAEPRQQPEPTLAAGVELQPAAEDGFSARLGTDEVPARFTLQEKWHSFSPTARSLEQTLDPARAYTVRISGAYVGEAPMPEQDLNQGFSPDELASSQLYIFLESEEVPAGERLFKATTSPYLFSGAQALHAFVLTSTSSQRYVNRGLALNLRAPRARKEARRPVDPKRFAQVLALENRYSVRKLDPAVTYTLEIRSKPGAPSSAVALVAVPRVGGGRVRVSGQPSGDFQYALQTGSYTIQGARELWFSLPRWEKDGEAEMEISLEPERAP